MPKIKAPKLKPMANSEPSLAEQMAKGIKRFKSVRTNFDIARPKRQVVTRYSK